MYKIKEFSAMTGLPQSKIRFYEKQGLLLSDRQENGYRVFTPEDAFRSNAFRMLLQYGFSIEEAIEMLDAKQGTKDFARSLVLQHKKLRQETDLIKYRLAKIDSTLDLIHSVPRSECILMDIPDHFYINASNGQDFSISLENEATIAEFYSLLSITSCARIIAQSDMEGDGSIIDPDYVLAIAEHEVHRLSKKSRSLAKLLCLGKCIRFRRKVTRAESVYKKTFTGLFEYLEHHGYRLRGDIILFPTFLNLDGQGSDIETLYVPIQ